MGDSGVEGQKMKEMSGVVGNVVEGMLRVKGEGRRRITGSWPRNQKGIEIGIGIGGINLKGVASMRGMAALVMIRKKKMIGSWVGNQRGIGIGIGGREKDVSRRQEESRKKEDRNVRMIQMMEII